MTKTEAIKLCGAATSADFARLLGMTRQAIDHWPDELPQNYIDRVVGLAVRLGKIKVRPIKYPHTSSE